MHAKRDCRQGAALPPGKKQAASSGRAPPPGRDLTHEASVTFSSSPNTCTEAQLKSRANLPLLQSASTEQTACLHVFSSSCLEADSEGCSHCRQTLPAHTRRAVNVHASAHDGHNANLNTLIATIMSFADGWNLGSSIGQQSKATRQAVHHHARRSSETGMQR